MSNFSSQVLLAEHNASVIGASLVEATLDFSIKAIHFKPNGPSNEPDCYLFNLQLVFDNRGEDGQLLVNLKSQPEHVTCYGNVSPPVSDTPAKNLRSAMNILVVLTCLVSFILCARAVIKAQFLKWVTIIFA